MFNSNAGYSLSDIAAATGRNNSGGYCDNGFMGNGAWWIIILFLFVFCGWGNGMGMNRGGGNGGGGYSCSVPAFVPYLNDGALTRADLCQDMNFQNMLSGIRGVQQGLCDGFYAQNTNTLTGFSGLQNTIQSGFAGVDNAICTLGYQTQEGVNSINVANMQNTNAIQRDINAGTVANMQNTNAIQRDINANTVANMQNTNAVQTQLASCCCDLKDGQKDIQYSMATDTCAIQNTIQNTTRDIIDNNNNNTRSILDFLIQDKISTLQSENQNLKLAASQAAQNSYLVDQLRPCPIPAYVTCNPWASNYGVGYNSCECNRGYGLA